MSLLHSLVKAEALINLHWKSAWVPTPILVSASITRQCAVEPFTQRCQGQNTYQSALTVWLSSKIDTCFGRRNKTMCKWVSSTTHLRSQRSSQTALPACGFQNWLVLATNQPTKEWINKNICHRQAIWNREAGNVPKGTMNQNNSSFSASNHSIAAYGLFPFIPLECWCKQTSKVTVLAVKQFNAEKLELFSKAHDPKHLKLSCIESLDGNICFCPVDSYSLFCNAGAGKLKGDSARLLDEAVVTTKQTFTSEGSPDRQMPSCSFKPLVTSSGAHQWGWLLPCNNGTLGM